MPEHAAPSPPQQQPQISSDRVLEILQREPMGAALLRAAIAEATVEVWQRRCAELEKQSQPAS